MTIIYPGSTWQRVSPAEVGLDPEKLAQARAILDDGAGEGRYRVAIVRNGYLAAEWNHGLSPEEKLNLASAAKSIFSCILGIAIAEGKIPSPDAKIVDFYPEAMAVKEGEGPKPGRYAFDKDRDITFRQLISNTSGYMKPGEIPGKVFNYQTYGMNILTHAIAKSYGLYDIADPEGSPGLKPLIEARLAQPIGAAWDYYKANFKLPPEARINIFGYYDSVKSSALDMARLGWLWCNWGDWRGQQLVPEAWLREATQTAPAIRANCPPEQWQYGYAFWTNADGQLWPTLPREAFTAAGNGNQFIWIYPPRNLVVIQGPGLWRQEEEPFRQWLQLIVEACQDDDS